MTWGRFQGLNPLLCGLCPLCSAPLSPCAFVLRITGCCSGGSEQAGCGAPSAHPGLYFQQESWLTTSLETCLFVALPWWFLDHRSNVNVGLIMLVNPSPFIRRQVFFWMYCFFLVSSATPLPPLFCFCCVFFSISVCTQWGVSCFLMCLSSLHTGRCQGPRSAGPLALGPCLTTVWWRKQMWKHNIRLCCGVTSVLTQSQVWVQRGAGEQCLPQTTHVSRKDRSSSQKFCIIATNAIKMLLK